MRRLSGAKNEQRRAPANFAPSRRLNFTIVSGPVNRTERDTRGRTSGEIYTGVVLVRTGATRNYNLMERTRPVRFR